MALGGFVAYPAHFKLIAAVAQVACHSDHINPLVGRDVGHILGLAVGKEDVLNAMETQEGVAQTVTGHGIAVFAVECLNHGRAVHEGVEGILVKRPGVDVGVNAKVSSGTEEESLAHLPLLTGGKEGLASLTDTGIGGIGFEGSQLAGQLFGLGSQRRVGGGYGVVYKLLGHSGGLGILDSVVIVAFAGHEIEGGEYNGHHRD